jgi:hypothetical protein
MGRGVGTTEVGRRWWDSSVLRTSCWGMMVMVWMGVEVDHESKLECGSRVEEAIPGRGEGWVQLRFILIN